MTFLDIVCVSLRAGIHFINYLNKKAGSEFYFSKK